MDDGPVLHDAVTLRHFPAADRRDVIEDIHGSLPEPRVAPAVPDEINDRIAADVRAAEELRALADRRQRMLSG